MVESPMVPRAKSSRYTLFEVELPELARTLYGNNRRMPVEMKRARAEGCICGLDLIEEV